MVVALKQMMNLIVACHIKHNEATEAGGLDHWSLIGLAILGDFG